MVADDLDATALLARHYIWQSLLQRAGGAPPELLAQIAVATAAEVPASLDHPIARVEWHIARILEVAQAMLADQAPPQSAVGLVQILGAANLASLTYAPHWARVLHLKADGQPCETALPAVCCTCGVYLLIGEARA